MSETSQRIANLSPEKRALLELRLMKKVQPAAKEHKIPRRGAIDQCPLSFAQQRLWFLDQFGPGSSVYNIPNAVRLMGLLDVTALEKSLNEIVQRHEALRTTFSAVQGEPVQIIAPTLPLKLPLTDLRELPANDREAKLRRLAAREARLPFDLARGPLLRAALLCLGEKDYVLLLTIHHIVSDGWSMGILFRELSTFYKAFCTGKPFQLPEPPIQYADFAVWQRQWVQGETLENQLSYWTDRLVGAPPLLELPTDRPRPSIQAYRGGRHSLILPASLTRALYARSREEGVTLFMMLLAGFKILLHRYTGQVDIIIGSPVANRNRVEIEELIGFFVNTMVLRTDLSGNPTFRELLGRVREVCLGAYAHQDLPFEKLVEELQPERTLSHSPLFQVMFILQNTPGSTLQLPGLTLNPMEVNSGAAKFDLTLSMGEGTEGLHGELEYDTDLFDASTIERMARHYQTILEGILADPEQRLSELPLLTASERHQLLVQWNDTKTDYPQDKCIHHLFEEQVERAPDATALVCEDQQITYRELNRRANQLAHFLQAQGVGPEVLVGICVGRSLEMVVGLLGILKAGGAYVPLDPTYPQERLAYMVSDTRMPIIVIQERFLKLFPDFKSKIVMVEREREVLAKQPQDNVQSGVKAEHLAYVIYTSGSTGKPKGVMIEHRNVVNLCTGMDACIEPELESTWLAVTSLSFDISVIEIFWTLARGFKVVIYPGNENNLNVLQEGSSGGQEAESNSYSILELIKLHNVTHFQCTPSMASMLMLDKESKSAFGRLQKFLIGGEAFPAALARQLQKVVIGDIINMFGPTETTVWSTTYKLKNARHSIPIGRPTANTEIYILDKHLQPVPAGVSGELMIGGAGVARGYLNRPELTSERFIVNPFSDNPDKLLYRTGDLCRYMPDGNIEFLGRIDHQVKLRGYRIEPGEIEVVLAEHPGVKTTLALVREDQPGDTRLVAYVVPKDGQALEVGNLRDYLKKKLPEYMVPGAFVMLESLPLTPNKKVDRLSLPTPDRIRSQPKEGYTAPRTPMEKKLAEIWALVLGLDQVGINDNFFDLGGHSLLAVRLFAYIEQTIGRKLPLAILFKASTIEQMARIIRDNGQQAPWSSLVEIQPDGSRQPLFLMHAAGGNVLCYRNLALHLGPDQPVYGLQSRGLDDRQPFHSRIDEMASYYIEAIKRVQPEGPYLLGGYCLGGSIALEIGHQLRAAGDEIDLLALFETYNWASIDAQSIFDKIYFYIQKLLFHWQNFQILRGKQKLTFLKEKLSVAKERRKVWYGMTASNLGKNFWRYTGEAQHLYKLWKNNHRAAKNYMPKTYPGQIIHFRPIKEYKKFDTPKARWENIAAEGVKTCRLPVYPAGMLLEPFVKILAEKLKELLTELNHGR